ncbi:hypothetical protein CLU88_4320 [Acidovorax sp. 56]|uniref:deoxynucleotide monophosphate kinase family protein n=1 Tax=Acidovorax sp. 56 TaxID=2035205 RepID=UPI000C163ACB|nr:hypothetical protein [Acidovorax sp. 56]PIF29391.1 hypothetical protein CLU88_4320 [Acidovorax sp. 56]
MNESTTIIGLTGPIGSGKDTVADLLATHCNARKLAFADALRCEISDAFSIEQVFLTRRETKEHPMSALALSRCLDTAFVGRVLILNQHPVFSMSSEFLNAPRSPRQIMQWWGTEYRRAAQPGYWVSKAAQRICYMHETLGTRLIVITDVRFDDEARLVRALGGQIWQIKRPGCEVGSAAHVSEVSGEGFAPNLVIENDHDMRHLQQLVLGGWAERQWRIPGVRVEIPA